MDCSDHGGEMQSHGYLSSKKGVIKYRECLKNHAASIGGAATDGCGEFMPGGEEGTMEALKCSACNCHRNFHRKEVEGEPLSYDLFYQKGLLISGSLGLIQRPYDHMAMARPPPMVIKRRYRTKFTAEQKEKMLGFAEKVGWRIQREEDGVVQQFCKEIGVRRRVLKVWMHNNKNNLAKKSSLQI
ncbi:zinc-finger homeodomain protein 4-like [Typha latifolia]|uniref:zinc-finger homeodomain protein 4-like n=1 Tax=Typha latifolia TaxID=4733 RepID=UPI003C2B2FEE